MNLICGDSIEVMATLPEASVDAIVTDPPYGLEFMGKTWDRLDANIDRWEGRRTKTAGDPPVREPTSPGGRHAATIGAAPPNPRCSACGHYQFSGTPCRCDSPVWIGRPNEQSRRMQDWHARWAEAAYRVAKPSAYLLAFGGTRTVHRMTCALEDAGWIIRDMLVWGYASGFPKSKASLKPAWEPIVMARKPGPLRMLAIDECRIGTEVETWPASRSYAPGQIVPGGKGKTQATGPAPAGRWPANIVLSDELFEPGVDGVIGADQGFSRFYCIPKAARSDREPVLGGHGLMPGMQGNAGGTWIPGSHSTPRANVHPTVKPVDLMRHLVRLVTPTSVCADCGMVLNSMRGQAGTITAPLPGMRRSDPDGSRQSGAVLFESLWEPTYGSEPSIDQGLREDGTGLHRGASPRSSDGDADGLRSPASAGHGGPVGPNAAPDRGRGSHQRREGRQPAGEPAGTGEASARQLAEAAEEADHLSPLRLDDPDLGSCAASGGSHSPRPGRVLDPFLGSGTTALAAEMEGFEWIGIEREAEYVAIAEARLNGTQRGLGLEVG